MGPSGVNAPAPTLTFAALDGIAFAAAKGRLNGHVAGPALIAAELGPLLELAQFAAVGLLPPPERTPWLSLDGTASLAAALACGRSAWVCPETRRAGLFRLAPEYPADDTRWLEFQLAAQKAAVGAGFSQPVASKFAAALGEMQSNVYEHSGAPGTGFVAFMAGAKVFEFVVADMGEGVLDSLRSCPEHAGLTDHGDALRLTLTDGVSRYGTGSNRGHGFRPLFIGLANLTSVLRFRSFDHALTIDGRSPDLMAAKVSRKPVLRGFLASVSCRLDGRA